MTGLRTALLEERERLVGAAAFLEKENAGSIEEELGEIAAADDNHLADMATATYDRELDEGLEEGAQHTLDEIDAALARIDDGSYGVCEVCGEPIGAGAPLRDPVGAPLHRRPAAAAGPARGTSRIDDERAGARVGRGALARRRAPAVGGLVAVAIAAVIADQVTKHIVVTSSWPSTSRTT